MSGHLRYGDHSGRTFATQVIHDRFSLAHTVNHTIKPTSATLAQKGRYPTIEVVIPKKTFRRKTNYLFFQIHLARMSPI